MVWVALVALGVAQAQEGAERPITYEEALTGSVERNAQLASALAQRDQAQGSLVAARGQFDPTYALEGTWRQSRNTGFFQGFPFDSDNESWQLTQSLAGSAGSGTQYSLNFAVDRNISEFVVNLGGVENRNLQDAYTSNLNVSLTQELLRGIRFAFNVQNVTSARTSLELADLELEKQRQEALYTAAQAYWSWAYQAELHQIALDSVAVAEEALRIGRLQVESGQLAPVEATRLAAALVQAQQSAIDAGNAAEQAANAMLLAMALDPSEAVSPATQPGDVPSALELDAAEAVEVALAQNLDVLVSRRNLEQTALDVANARHGMLPSLTATASAGVASQRCPPEIENCEEGNAFGAIRGLTADDNQPFVELRGRFSVPLGNRAARGDRNRLQAQKWQREQELAALERSIAAQVEEQVRVLQSARQRTEHLQFLAAHHVMHPGFVLVGQAGRKDQRAFFMVVKLRHLDDVADGGGAIDVRGLEPALPAGDHAGEHDRNLDRWRQR